VVAVVPFDKEDESPFVGMLKIDAIWASASTNASAGSDLFLFPHKRFEGFAHVALSSSQPHHASRLLEAANRNVCHVRPSALRSSFHAW
jgi:hypothetical protein